MIRFPDSELDAFFSAAFQQSLNPTRRKLPEFKFWFGAIRAAALACLVSLGLCGLGGQLNVHGVGLLRPMS